VRVTKRDVRILVAVAVPSLAGATLAVALLEGVVGVPNASTVYLLAVIACAFAAGAIGGIVASVASFLLYDFLFVEPLYTFTIRDPGEWLNLGLLLVVGIVVGELTALQRARTDVARAREREARALFRVSRRLATRPSTVNVLPAIAESLRTETGMDRVWISLGEDDAREAVAADTGSAPRPSLPAVSWILRRTPGDEPAEWVRVHRPGTKSRGPSDVDVFRVRIEATSAVIGSIWGLRPRAAGTLDPTATRLLASSADQLGQAIAQDRLAAESQAAEIARQSDALKSALLQSVSHDLRTPLATIRAAAGTLRPGSGVSPADQEASVAAIDREVEYLNRMVTNLLDLSRIEAGVLRSDRDVFLLDDLVEQTLDRCGRRLGARPLEVRVDAIPVSVDPIFFDEALTNVVDNAIKYTPPGGEIRVSASAGGSEDSVRLTVEDAGPGVPAESLDRLFEKFYRVAGTAGGSRSGTGIGLAVVRGLVEAMGGRVTARPSSLGGLAIDLELPRAGVPTLTAESAVA
jgi:two-component system sensor histidine kinase KdpD